MGNAHEVVVHDVRQVIGWQPIGLQQHGIVQIGVLEDHRAAQLILDDRLPLQRRRQPHDKRLACCGARFSDIRA